MFKYGIIGAGSIARYIYGEFEIAGAEVAAVASKSLTRAEAFAKEFGVGSFYGSYQELLAARNVDAVYVATDHASHKDVCLLCISHGVPVLCEKAFALDRRQATKIFRTAQSNRVPVMEAMWTRFLPKTAELRNIISSGAYGRPLSLRASLGFDLRALGPESRVFAKKLGGGALLDMGVYLFTISRLVFKKTPVAACKAVISGGVDIETSVVLNTESGRAELLCSVVRDLENSCEIQFEKAKIILPEFWKGSEIIIESAVGRKTLTMPQLGLGYAHEIAHFCSLVSSGGLFSDVMPPSETLAVLELCDRCRKKTGLA